MTDEITFDTDEKLGSLIQLDELLAHQYFATFRRKELEPEKQLMLAVLEDAVTCFQRYIFWRNRRARTLYNETEDWICDENTDYAFSFDNICAVFGLDAKYVREGLLRWKKSKLAQRQQQIVRIPSARSEELIRKLYSGGATKRVERSCREKTVARFGWDLLRSQNAGC